ncbi:hypothetical protein MUN77_03460 [Leucobacter allii]|uniref:hypothetical protein n=1 Tax=Leucobacter allii TaxID=2932247 RepID=UPI001FD4D275|nr:hypothetical protein [Leucobacter allii]UOR02386.1 hypothetical protein MUN77_03460 [Leucobacter allii]
MFSGIIAGVINTFDFLARYLPSLRLIMRIIHRRDSHKWGVPAMLIAAPYFLVANIFKELIEDGGEAWISLPMLWCLVMGIVFAMMGPVGLVLLGKARVGETIVSLRERRPRDPRT